MKILCSMREALEDDNVLGRSLPGESWRNWRTLLIASRGEALTAEEREIYRELTTRECEPAEPVDEFWSVVGRGGGKTAALSTAAAYFAGCVEHEGRFKAGQRGRLPVIAVSKSTAAEAFNYLSGIFGEFPFFADLVDGDPTSDTIRLTNRVDIMVMAASFRTVRGATFVACLCDELAYWSIEGMANPDKEILRAVRPALARYGDAPPFVLSSPYAKRGELYETYKDHYRPGGDPRVLVVQAPTLKMHDTPDLQRAVARAYQKDPESARAEYGAEFREGISDFVSRELVDQCTDFGVREREPDPNARYTAFIDPSGGTGKDAMTLAVAHQDATGNIVVDLVVGVKPPFSPDAVCQQFAATLKPYRVSTVVGDNYANEWPKELIRKYGITYEQCPKAKAGLYIEFLPLLNSGKVRLLDHDKMRNELLNLERRTNFGGKDNIDHPNNGHDDYINAVAGVVWAESNKSKPLIISKELMEWAKRPTDYSRRHSDPMGIRFMRGF
ncbi:hypothetical protein MKL09_09795 [Methylobacterium sp. J-048]|uniref:hypothetical protein n=1 Tax=Methylobacterium sp. J-048 TaxID=2836635 RepID=UPI001FBA690A|nr:hypothetical protein [Methylobacterium sp. J-048]MCJ2056846.1 hypothetical protein [Methylobacterium sp. J-048]